MELQDILAETQKVLQKYQKDLSKYSVEAFSHKISPEKWSLAQMYEHLVTASSFFMHQAMSCLNPEKASADGKKNEIGENVFKYNSFPPVKIKVPDKYNTTGEPVGQDAENYQTLFAELITKAQDIANALSADNQNLSRQHAVFGSLTGKEWFQCIFMHAKHHHTQQKELEQAVGLEA